MEDSMDSTSINKNTTLPNMTFLTINPSYPFFIHALDHPSMTLVLKVLNGTNYAMWRRSITTKKRGISI
jgi:hypothetical protein